MMKDLKTYLLEGLKPPRLSAKNKELWTTKPLDEEEVMKWLKENCKIKGSVDIVNGKINVNGDVSVMGYIEEFPYPFEEVTGDFDCSECKNLKSLNNSPQMVGGYFSCSGCESLTSLEGAPQEVGNFFGCSNCKNLTSLEDAPKEVGHDFWCYNCGKEFTKSDVRKVCKVKGDIYV